MTGEEDEIFAAELALGVIEGAQRTAALARAASDPEFALTVELWSQRLAPMLDGIAPVAPPPAVLDVLLRKAGGAIAANDPLPALRRSVTLWRSAAGGAAALAAAFALLLVVQPGAVPVPGPAATVPPSGEPASQPPLVAVIADKGAAKMLASFDPQAATLVVAGGSPLPASATEDYELWVIPISGTPVSLGLMPANSRLLTRLPLRHARLIGAGATLAVTVEPEGGSPTGKPTGAVIASGALSQA